MDAPEPGAANSSEGEETGARPLNFPQSQMLGKCWTPLPDWKAQATLGGPRWISGGPVPWAEAIAQVPAPVPANEE